MARSYTVRGESNEKGQLLINAKCVAYDSTGAVIETQYTDSTGSCTFTTLPDTGIIDVLVQYGTTAIWYRDVMMTAYAYAGGNISMGGYSITDPVLDLGGVLGSDHSYRGVVYNLTAQVNFAYGELGHYSYLTGTVVKSTLATVENLIAVEAITAGNAGHFLNRGVIRHNAWAFTPWDWVYPDSAGGGGLATTATTGAGVNILPVGRALSSTTMWFDPPTTGVNVGDTFDATSHFVPTMEAIASGLIENGTNVGDMLYWETSGTDKWTHIDAGTDGQILRGYTGSAPEFSDNWEMPDGGYVVFWKDLATDHTSSGVQAKLTAGIALTRFQTVYIGADGKMELSDANSSATMPVYAMLAHPTCAEDAISYFNLKGFVRDDSWAWTPGGLLYASETAGAITQTAPTTANAIVQVVGVAISATIIWFDPQGMIDVTATDASSRAITSNWAHDHGELVAAAAVLGHTYMIDEDNMVSDSDTQVPTQQSVKAYVDTEIAGVSAGTGTGDETIAWLGV